MISIEGIKYSLRNIRQRRARSFLTILSILVGIATIFIFISFGWGLYDYMEDVSSESSANKVIIQAKGSGMPGLDDTFKLTDSDLRAIKRASGVYEASGTYFKVAEVKQGTEKLYTFIIAYEPDNPLILQIYNIDTVDGRWLDSGDDGNVVLGYSYQLEGVIFSKRYEINDRIEIQGEKLRIVGFVEEIGNPQDDSQIYIINDYLDDLYPDNNNSYAMIVAEINTNDIECVVSNIERNLRKSRNLEKGKEDFFVQSFDDLMKTYLNAMNIIIAFIILIALISVLVSTVNTANTMITSVIERYKEIGIIKAIGAKNSEVLGIFLFESSFLGLLAGIMGVIVGAGLSYLGGVALDTIGWGFLSPHFSVIIFVGCILFATVTGALSGVFPAIRASKINTVDALRYE